MSSDQKDRLAEMVLAELKSRTDSCWPSDLMEGINAGRELRRPCSVRDVRDVLDRLERIGRATKDDQGLWSVRV